MEKAPFSTTGNSSLAHQEVVSDVMYETSTKKSHCLTAAIINTAENGNFSAKTTIIEEE